MNSLRLQILLFVIFFLLTLRQIFMQILQKLEISQILTFEASILGLLSLLLLQEGLKSTLVVIRWIDDWLNLLGGLLSIDENLLSGLFWLCVKLCTAINMDGINFPVTINTLLLNLLILIDSAVLFGY